MRKEYRLLVNIVTTRYFSEEGPYGDGETMYFNNLEIIKGDTIDEVVELLFKALEDNKVLNFKKRTYEPLFISNNSVDSITERHFNELKMLKKLKIEEIISSHSLGCEGYAELKKFEIVYIPEEDDEVKNFAPTCKTKIAEVMTAKVDSFVEELKVYKKNRIKSFESEKVRKEKALLKELKEKYEGIK